MSRFIYRVCLIAVLLIAVAGGFYYYTTVYEKEAGPQKGTFVDRGEGTDPCTEYAGRLLQTDWPNLGRLPETFRQSEVRNTGKQVYLAAENTSARTGNTSGKTKEAFVYVTTGKKIPAQTAESGKEADSHGSTGYALFEN